MKISKHVSYKEGVRSNTATRRGIDNTPTDDHLHFMEIIAHEIFEPLREWVGGPIKINSFYRSRALNEAIGGSTLSQHMRGQAIDIDDVYGHKTNKEMFHYIKENLDFDQMIWEFGNDENPDWIHVSYVGADRNRKKILRAVRESGKTKYIDITNV